MKNKGIVFLEQASYWQNKQNDYFNDYFTDIAKYIGPDDVIKNDENLFSCLLKHDNHESIKCKRNFIKTCDINTKFSFHTVEVSTIRKHLEKLQPNKATGYDIILLM